MLNCVSLSWIEFLSIVAQYNAFLPFIKYDDIIALCISGLLNLNVT